VIRDGLGNQSPCTSVRHKICAIGGCTGQRPKERPAQADRQKAIELDPSLDKSGDGQP
jgi:hypothetical protein